MTKLEAAEIILQSPLRECVWCEGSGEHVTWATKGRCYQCRGTGKMYPKKYRRACGVLGLTCPDRYQG